MTSLSFSKVIFISKTILIKGAGLPLPKANRFYIYIIKGRGIIQTQ